MKKQIITIVFILIATAGYSQIVIGSQKGGTIKLDQDILFSDPAAAVTTITLKNVDIETTGNISFGKVNLVLIDSKITCRNLSFSTLRSLVTSGNVEIGCINFELPATTLPFTKIGNDARLTIVYESNFTNANNYTVPSAADFTVNIKGSKK